MDHLEQLKHATRPKDGREFLGVSLGLSKALDVPVNWIRAGFFFFGLFAFPITMGTYLALAIALPEEDESN